jgi:hypothetical protein
MIGVAIADVNGDGRDDLVYIDGPEAIPSSEPMPNWLGVQLQRPDGTLDTPTLSPWPNHGFAIVSVSDIDGDRHADVVYNTNPGFGVALGDGRGNFAMEGQYDGTNDPARGVPRLLDFDGDGRPDLLFASDWLGVNTGVTVAFGRDPVPPHVTLTAPTPLLAIGAGTTLSWTVSDNVGIHDAEAFVSRHGLQGPFRSIGRVAGADEAMDWTVTGPPSDSVAFKIVVRDSAGNVGWDRGHTLGSIAQLPTGVTDASLPKRLALHLAGANPVHERLALRMELPRAGRARLALYDLQGRKVASLLDEDRPAGVSTSEFDLSSRGPGLRAGLYFLRLESSRERALARVALVP